MFHKNSNCNYLSRAYVYICDYELVGIREESQPHLVLKKKNRRNSLFNKFVIVNWNQAILLKLSIYTYILIAGANFFENLYTATETLGKSNLPSSTKWLFLVIFIPKISQKNSLKLMFTIQCCHFLVSKIWVIVSQLKQAGMGCKQAKIIKTFLI